MDYANALISNMIAFNLVIHDSFKFVQTQLHGLYTFVTCSQTNKPANWYLYNHGKIREDIYVWM
jgi:hypothetical protein